MRIDRNQGTSHFKPELRLQGEGRKERKDRKGTQPSFLSLPAAFEGFTSTGRQKHAMLKLQVQEDLA